MDDAVFPHMRSVHQYIGGCDSGALMMIRGPSGLHSYNGKLEDVDPYTSEIGIEPSSGFWEVMHRCDHQEGILPVVLT